MDGTIIVHRHKCSVNSQPEGSHLTQVSVAGTPSGAKEVTENTEYDLDVYPKIGTTAEPLMFEITRV